MIGSPVTAEGSYQKRKEAMKKRIASLGKSNPVVARAVKNQNPPEEDVKWKNWNVVDELVSAARQEYFKNEKESSMNECVAHLAAALQKLSGKRGLDTASAKDNNSDQDEDD